MRGIHSRVETFGGTIAVRSQAGGTIVDVELPISELAMIEAGFAHVPVP